MNRMTSDSRSELRVSARPIICMLMVVALALVLFGERQPNVPHWNAIHNLALLCYGFSVVSWLLHGWKPWAGRWSVISALFALVLLGANWLDVPELLTLMSLPAALAAATMGLAAATTTAIAGTALLVLLPEQVAAHASPVMTMVSLIGIWASIGVMVAIYQPMYKRNEQLERYFQRTRDLLEEGWRRKADLEQAMGDLTHANRQLALTNERVTALRLIAEEAQKAKTIFVARVSHEFRTPLNMIIGLVDLMVDSPEIYDVTLSPQMRQDLKTVHRNCEHLSDMIDDVLDLTRIEADGLVLHRERVNIEGIIDSAVEAVRPMLESKRLALQISFLKPPPQVYCDRTRIQQVVLNLMSNAARYTEEGGITVEVGQRDHHILVSVTDTGPGIRPEDVERIFEPFCQGKSDLWRDKGGSGLGLSISKQFVELHGGRMWVESELGVGTTFAFELPISPPIAPAGRPGHQIRDDWIWHVRHSKPNLPAAHYNPRFVICDEIGELYGMLTPYSAEVELVHTQDFEQAINVSLQAPAHAVLLNLTAFEDIWPSIEAISQRALGTPIIGCSVPRSFERAGSLGALGYLTKPVTRGDLERTIEAAGPCVRQVLVVDDDPDVLQLFDRMLRVCDGTLEIATASSGEEALDHLRRTPPDLMLLDIVMPNMDGWQVLESMSRDEGIPMVPTFLVSAQDPTDEPPRSKFLLATVDKGLSPGKLLNCSLEISKLLLQPEGALGREPA